MILAQPAAMSVLYFFLINYNEDAVYYWTGTNLLDYTEVL